MWFLKKGGSGMNEIRKDDRISSITLPEHKTKLVFGDVEFYLTKKPNLFMRLFLKLLGVKVVSLW